MSKKLKKTNAARILDGLGIAYEIKTYDVDENDLSAVHVAQMSGMNDREIHMRFPLSLKSPQRSEDIKQYTLPFGEVRYESGPPVDWEKVRLDNWFAKFRQGMEDVGGEGVEGKQKLTIEFG